MEYRVSKVPTHGEGLPLYNVAVSMAYADANDKGGFIKSVYERRLREHINILIAASRAGNLEITSRDGMCGTMEQFVSYAQASGNFISIDDTNIAEALVAFTFLPMLNIWGQRFGYTFVFAEHDSHAEIIEGNERFSLGGKPSLPPTYDQSTITSQSDAPNGGVTNTLWLIKDPRDQEPEGFQPWYISARYFARILVKEDSTLLTKRELLVKKVAISLKAAGILKRGGKIALSTTTIKKALSNIDFN